MMTIARRRDDRLGHVSIVTRIRGQRGKVGRARTSTVPYRGMELIERAFAATAAIT